MLKVEHKKWDQSIEQLHELAKHAAHPRTRERLMALHVIASGRDTATSWAATTGRENETVMRWVHRYNAEGPAAMTYRRTGGARPLFRLNKPRHLGRSLSTMSPRITA